MNTNTAIMQFDLCELYMNDAYIALPNSAKVLLNYYIVFSNEGRIYNPTALARLSGCSIDDFNKLIETKFLERKEFNEFQITFLCEDNFITISDVI